VLRWPRLGVPNPETSAFPAWNARGPGHGSREFGAPRRLSGGAMRSHYYHVQRTRGVGLTARHPGGLSCFQRRKSRSPKGICDTEHRPGTAWRRVLSTLFLARHRAARAPEHPPDRQNSPLLSAPPGGPFNPPENNGVVRPLRAPRFGLRLNSRRGMPRMEHPSLWQPVQRGGQDAVYRVRGCGSLETNLQIQRALRVLERYARNGLRVDHRRLHAAVAKQLLDRHDVVVGLQEVAGE